MTSSNIQKMVQNNFHLNPWVLSKNTNEIVNTCIQKIYKQMPHNLRKDLKPAKIASVRPENKGPIRTWKSLQCEQQQTSKIVPQPFVVPSKKSARSKPSQAKLNQDRLMTSILKTTRQHNLQNNKKSAITSSSNKKLFVSPNLKIYGSRRFGSSASSSRSSLYRRHDEKRRSQRQPYQSQLNYLVRAFHTEGFDGTLAKYLLPSRNQQLKGNLGSLPDAMKVSSSIQNDLMMIDAAVRHRISVGGKHKPVQGKPQSICEPEEVDRLQVWKHPPPLDKFRTHTLSELMGKTSQRANYRNRSKLSPEHRDFGRYQSGPIMHIKPSSPPKELFTAEHDRQNTELQEKHRRNRMKKLGLIKDSPMASATQTKSANLGETDGHIKSEIEGKSNVNMESIESGDCCYNKSSPLSLQLEASRRASGFSKNRRRISHFPVVKTDKVSWDKDSDSAMTCKVKTSGRPKQSRSPSDVIMSPTTSESSNLPDRVNGPLALATANLVVPSIVANRYNPSNYFSIRKY